MTSILRFFFLCAILVLIGVGCSPLRSSSNDEKHQLELTLHEVQTNLDDIRHDVNCYQTEIQILDARIKHYENALASLKQQDLEKQQAKIDLLTQQLHSLEKRGASLEKTQARDTAELDRLLSHANETAAALSQFKSRIQEIESDVVSQNRRFEELAKLKGNLDSIAKGLGAERFKIYKVRPGDSLEKIARDHKTAVEKIKKNNQLDCDLIVIGQELKIPID
jgi:chromosome segregation ATPase